MYSNSLYISEGSLKYKTVENSFIFLNRESHQGGRKCADYICSGMLLMFFRDTHGSISFPMTHHFKK